MFHDICMIYLQFVADLNKCTNWEEKLDAFISRLPADSELAISVENQRAICDVLYKRMLAIESYEVSNLPLLNAPIILLKPTEQLIKSISEDYGLGKVYISTF